MRTKYLVALLAVLALIASSCGGDSLEAAAECDGEIPSGSTVTVKTVPTTRTSTPLA